MILVAGCGYVGETVADMASAAGIDTVGLTHSPESAEALGKTKPYPVLACDLSVGDQVASLPDVIEATGNAPPSTIVHCASSGRGGADAYRRVYVGGCRHLLQSFPDSHLLFTSSTSVYPQIDGSWVDESTTAEPERETGTLLREAEESVLSQGGTIARLAGIFGPGRSVILKRFLQQVSTIDAGVGGSDETGRFLNQAHRDDIAAAITHLLFFCGDDSRGEVYNVCDDRPLTQRECYSYLSEKFSIPLPPAVAPDLGRKRGWTHKQVSNAKLRETGWEPAFPSYLNAIEEDEELVPSILAQVEVSRGSTGS